MNKQKKVLILFSGGTDSTAAAVYYLKKGVKTYLVTFDNGVESDLDLSEKKSKIIIKKFPQLCSWRMLNSKDLFHKMAIKTLEKDVKKYGVLVCCACKLAMLSESILFCMKNHINIIADGFQKSQNYYPEQTQEYIKVASRLCGKFNIKNEHPLYDLTSERIKNIILSAGIPAKPQQAKCLFGENRIKSEYVEKYTLNKLNIALNYIAEKRYNAK
ncbi:MAG: 7-cyano-7-deazaguanine synthase [Elusimicrobia bacterium ADurb.Bin231]|nr:MAG: 7-cyano-7-deazaguanine synthase [Elusimicrobia bacterium ADurb.Bin231]